MTKYIKQNKRGMTLVEVILAVSILSIISLVIVTLYYSGLTFSTKGIYETIITTGIKQQYTILTTDFKNSITDTTETNLLTLTMSDSSTIHYEYKNNSLYRNNIEIIKNISEFSFSKPEIKLLEVHMSFKKHDVEIKMPINFLIYRRN